MKPRIQLSATQPNFCMPAALACLTGKTVDDCIDLFKKELGDVPIQGVFGPILLKILKEHGFDWQELSKLEAVRFIGDMIVFIEGHVMIYDSICKKWYDPKSPDGRANMNYRRKVENIFAVRYPPVKPRSELFSRVHR